MRSNLAFSIAIVTLAILAAGPSAAQNSIEPKVELIDVPGELARRLNINTQFVDKTNDDCTTSKGQKYAAKRYCQCRFEIGPVTVHEVYTAELDPPDAQSIPMRVIEKKMVIPNCTPNPIKQNPSYQVRSLRNVTSTTTTVLGGVTSREHRIQFAPSAIIGAAGLTDTSTDRKDISTSLTEGREFAESLEFTENRALPLDVDKETELTVIFESTTRTVKVPFKVKAKVDAPINYACYQTRTRKQVILSSFGLASNWEQAAKRPDLLTFESRGVVSVQGTYEGSKVTYLSRPLVPSEDKACVRSDK